MHTSSFDKSTHSVRRSEVLRLCSFGEESHDKLCAPLTKPSHKLCLESVDDPVVRVAPVKTWKTDAGMCVTCYALPLEKIPADFFADPDGNWTYESLVQAARFSTNDGVAIGALKAPFNGHPDGAAVVTLNAESRPYIAIVECPIAFTCAEEHREASVA